jgi:hypothetical protein
MRAPLTSEEDAVLLEFKRRDVKPGEEEGVIYLIAESCNMSCENTRKAAQRLFKKGYLYIGDDDEEERIREILQDLLLYDPSIHKIVLGIIKAEQYKPMLTI